MLSAHEKAVQERVLGAWPTLASRTPRELLLELKATLRRAHLDEILRTPDDEIHKWVKLDPKEKSVQLTKAGMQLDLGGIVKGWAADVALEGQVHQVVVDGHVVVERFRHAQRRFGVGLDRAHPGFHAIELVLDVADVFLGRQLIHHLLIVAPCLLDLPRGCMVHPRFALSPGNGFGERKD